jgi:alanine racemase
MKGLIKGNFVNQVGTISMDQMSFDVTDIEDVAEGDVITIIGSQYHGNRYNQSGLKAAISIADWACASDTITYELVCRLKLRLPRVFSRARMSQSICPGDLA